MSQIDRYFERYGPAYKWFATGTIMVATISVVLSTTIVNVAIPAVMGAFGISAVQAQWISTGFLAAMTATMLLADWANRAFGMRLTMNAAMGIFLGGSILGGLAPNETVLTLARVVQGAAAGIVQPLAMIMLFRVFPPASSSYRRSWRRKPGTGSQTAFSSRVISSQIQWASARV